ncbi:MAG: DUF350 domain-containing protein [Myxococcota bacterium]|nr:DUF350 domain-containing protein [Myxococcota bacterium]
MTTTQILYLAGSLLVSTGVVLLARVLYAKLSAYDVDDQLTEADNPAIGVALFGFIAGVTAVMLALLHTDSHGDGGAEALRWDLIELTVYGLLSIFLLKAAGWINNRFITQGFENQKELVQDRNVGVGALLGGSYLASGLILAGALSGRADPELIDGFGPAQIFWFELQSALVFFLLGQVALIVFARVYGAVQKEDVLHEIERDYEIDGRFYGGNAAAGMAFGGSLVAFSLVLFAGAHGDFEGWGHNIAVFGYAALVGLLVLPIWRLFVDKVMLPKADLAKEIYEDRNVNAALLESVCLIALALVILFVFPDLSSPA